MFGCATTKPNRNPANAYDFDSDRETGTFSFPATSAKELDTLRLSWGLIAVGDMVSLEVENLTSQEPHFQDDVDTLYASS